MVTVYQNPPSILKPLRSVPSGRVAARCVAAVRWAPRTHVSTCSTSIASGRAAATRDTRAQYSPSRGRLNGSVSQ